MFVFITLYFKIICILQQASIYPCQRGKLGIRIYIFVCLFIFHHQKGFIQEEKSVATQCVQT